MPDNKYNELNLHSVLGEPFPDEQELKLDNSLRQGMEVPAQQGAQIDSLSRDTGIDHDTIGRNREQIDKDNRYSNIDLKSLISDSPTTAEFLSTVDNARQAHDDIEPLTKAEIALRNREYMDETGIGTRLKARTIEGWANLKNSVSNLARMGDIERGASAETYGDYIIAYDPAGNPIWQSHTFMPDRFRQQDLAATAGLGQDQSRLLARDAAAHRAKIASLPQRPATIAMLESDTYGDMWDAFTVDPLGIIADIGITSAVQQLPALAATVATRNPGIAMAAAGGNSYALEMGHGVLGYLGSTGVDVTNADAVVAALSDDATVKRAMAYANTRGIIVGGMDLLSVGIASKSLVSDALIDNKIVRESLNSFIVQPVVQGTMGAGGEAGAQLATEGEISSPGELFAEFIGEFSQAPIEASAFAFQRYQETRADATRLDQVATAAKASKLRESNPEAFRELMERMGIDSESDVVYLDAEAAKLLFQEDVDSELLEQPAVQAIITDLPAALEAGRDIEVSMADYLTDLVDTPFSDLQAHMRMNPEALTPAQLASEDIQETIEEMRAANDAEVESESIIHTDVVGQFVSMNYDQSTSEQYASLWETSFEAIASRPGVQAAGLSAMDLYQRYNPTIGREVDPAVQQRAEAITELDIYLDRLRSADVPRGTDVFGESVVPFLLERGGIDDVGGELASRDIDVGRVGGQRVARKEGGMSLDGAAEILAEARYIDERDEQLVLDAIEAEIGGEPRYAMGAENAELQQVRQTLLELDEILERAGLDVMSLSNEEIREALESTVGEDAFTQLPADQFEVDRSADGGQFVIRATDNEQDVGRMQVETRGTDQMQIVEVELSPEKRGEGIGQQFIQQAHELAISEGRTLVSDVAVSAFQLRAYEALKRRGWTIEYAEPELVAERLQLATDAEAAGKPASAVGVGSTVGDTPVVTRIEPPVERGSDAFDTWFGDSKVVDENNEPLVVYHGTPEDFTEFDGLNTAGWFSESADLVNRRYAGFEGGVMPVYLAINNPIELTEFQDMDAEASTDEIVAAAGLKEFYDGPVNDTGVVYEVVNSLDFVAAAREAGFDGIHVTEDGVATWAAFDAEQIKSTSNEGAFDPNDPNILRQDDTETDEQFGEFATTALANDPLAAGRAAVLIDQLQVKESEFNIEDLLAQTDELGFYSAIAKAIEDMPLPEWKAKRKQEIYTKEMRERHGIVEQQVDSKMAAIERDGNGVDMNKFMETDLWKERTELREKEAQQDLANRETNPASGKAIWQKLQKMPGIKKEELEWTGIEEFLTAGEKYTRQQVLNFIDENGVVLEETVATGDGGEADSLEWDAGTVWDDEKAWQHNVEDMLYEFDQGSADVLYMDVGPWMYNWLVENVDTVIANYEPALPKDQINELNEIESPFDQLKWLEENADAEPDMEMRGQARPEFEEEATSVAEAMYMEDPLYIYETEGAPDEATSITIFGNDDQGYSIRDGGNLHTDQISSQTEGIYSLSEAQVQAEQYAREEGMLTYEDDVEVAKWADYVEGDYDNYREVKIKLPTDRKFKGEYKDYYNDVHFPDPNIIAFQRVTDRELVARPIEGGLGSYWGPDPTKKTYMVDEFQSDWHQQGRQTGYNDGSISRDEVVGQRDRLFNIIEGDAGAAFRAEKNALSDNDGSISWDGDNRSFIVQFAAPVSPRNPNGGDSVSVGEHQFIQYAWNIFRNSDDAKNALSDDIVEPIGIGSIAAYRFVNGVIEERVDAGSRRVLNQLVKDFDEAERKLDIIRNGVPDAPFKNDAWIALGLKRALIQAVDDEYTQFAWADSEVLVNRWSDRYRSLYEMQYDKKMPSIIKKLTGKKPVHLGPDGTPHQHEELGYWVIELDEQLRTKIQDSGLPMFQEGGNKGPRGYFDPNNNRITLTPKANLTTFFHESGHLFLNVLRDLSDTDQSIQDDLSKLETWWTEQGAKNDRDRHEMFASGFETYLQEGKAPTPELQPMFARFQSWLVMVYKRLGEAFRRNKLEGVELSDEVRGVMDRLVASQDAIDRAVSTDPVGPLPVEQLGLTPIEAREYQTIVDAGNDEANAQLTAQVMREGQRERETWWRDSVKEKAVEIDADMSALPAYRARDFLSGDVVPDGIEASKLDSAYVRDIYGSKAARKLQRMSAKGGSNPDVVAPYFGFRNGDEMIKALLGTMNKSERSTYVKKLAENQMRSEHGEMKTDGTLDEKAKEAVANDKQAERLLYELKILNRSAGKQQTPRQFFRAAAERTIAETPVDSIRPDIHRRNEIKARNAAVKAAAQEDYSAAALEQHRAVRQFYLYREAVKVKRIADGHRNRLMQIKKVKYSARRVHPDYIQQLKVLVSAYDLRKNPKDSNARLDSIRAFVQAQKDTNPDLITDSLIDRVRSWKSMTISELSAVRDAAENLLKIGKNNSDIEREEFRQLTEGLANNIIDKTDVPKPAHTNHSLVSRAKKAKAEFSAAHRKLESLIQELDGWVDNGPMAEAVFKPLWDAQIAEIDRMKTEHEELNTMFEGYNYLFNALKDSLQDVASTTKYVDLHNMAAGNGVRSLSRGERIILALNWGNEGNRAALLTQEGHAFSEEGVMAALQTLTREELQLVNRLWEYVDKFYPELAKTEQEATGVAPGKVDASPFTVNGVEMRGGYYPLQADSALSWKAEMHAVEERAEKMKQGGKARATTKHGSTIERVGFGKQIIDLSIDGLFKHVDGVVHDITHRQAVLDVDRVLRSPQVREAASAKIGREGYRAISQAVVRLAGGATHPSDLAVLNRLMRFSRIATSYGAMGYSARTGILNLTGFLPAIPEVGKVRMVSSLLEEMANPRKFGREIKAKSKFMESRSITIERDVFTIMRNLKGNTGWNSFKAHAFWMIVQVDAFMSRAVWNAAYNKALNQGRDEDGAVFDADRTVTRTQGSGMKIDLSAVEDQNEIYRAMSPMYTYFNAILNLARRQKGKHETGQTSNLEYLESMFWIFIVVAFVEEAMFGYADDDEERFDEKWWERQMRSQGGYYLGQWFGIRELSGWVEYGQMFETPLQRVLAAPPKAAAEVLELAFDPDAEFDKQSVRAATDLLPVLGFPSGAQVNRMSKYLIEYEETGGEFDPYGFLVTGRNDEED